jgi:hypothetical protein
MYGIYDSAFQNDLKKILPQLRTTKLHSVIIYLTNDLSGFHRFFLALPWGPQKHPAPLNPLDWTQNYLT